MAVKIWNTKKLSSLAEFIDKLEEEIGEVTNIVEITTHTISYVGSYSGKETTIVEAAIIYTPRGGVA